MLRSLHAIVSLPLVRSRWLLLSIVALAAPAAVATASDIADQAKCLVKTNAQAARVFAASVPGSEAERQALTIMAVDLRRCTGLEEADAAQGLQLGGAIAELEIKKEARAVIRRRFIGFDPQHMDSLGVSERALERAQSWPPSVAVAFCAGVRDPRSAAAILRSKPGSTGETKAMQLLRPAIQRCVDNGRTFALNAPALRAVLARSEFSSRFTSYR